MRSPSSTLYRYQITLNGNYVRIASNHVAGTLFQGETGTKYQFIYYRSSSLAMPDMIAGRIHFMIDTAANSVPQVRTGTIKGFAVTAKSRLPALPDLPTVDEAGLPGFYCLNWHGLWVPKGTPRAIIDKLNDAVVQALAHPSVRQRLGDLGHEIFPREQQTPEGAAAFQKAEIECVSAWNKDPVFGVIGIQSGPRG
jgi:tripartite-type tricarboxylate transporter receptor subunit TctC